jgi:hypothetical protein
MGMQKGPPQGQGAPPDLQLRRVAVAPDLDGDGELGLEHRQGAQLACENAAGCERF